MSVQFAENLVKRSVRRVGGCVHSVIAVTVSWGVIGGDVAQTKTSVGAIVVVSSAGLRVVLWSAIGDGVLRIGGAVVVFVHFFVRCRCSGGRGVVMVGISGCNDGAGCRFLPEGYRSPWTIVPFGCGDILKTNVLK